MGRWFRQPALCQWVMRDRHGVIVDTLSYEDRARAREGVQSAVDAAPDDDERHDNGDVVGVCIHGNAIHYRYPCKECAT